ncbi:MAG: ATP-binding protein [Polyangiales bacterium]
MTGRVTAPRGWSLHARLRAGLGVLAVLTFTNTVTTVVALRRYAAASDAAVRDVAIALRARSLGVDAREQYLQEVQTMVLGDRSRVLHHGAWAGHFRIEARDLARELPADRPALEAIIASSREVDDAFRREILPAVDRGDRAAVLAAHGRAEAAVVEMIRRADEIGARFEARAAQTRLAAAQSARVATRLALAHAGLAVLFALLVARSVWRAFDGPTARLRAVAARVSGGDTDARVGELAVPELAEVARAFDTMLDRLAAREAALVRAERLAVIGRFAAGVAHEINNPIGVIRGYLKTMLREGHEATLRRELEILDEEALACQRICEDLLTYARAPTLALAPSELASLGAETVQRLRDTGELGDIEVSVDMDRCEANVDPLRMRQVLGNLLRNAAQATQAPAELTGRVEGARYLIRLSDRGPGVAPELRPQLFEPFATNRIGGSGLGLAVSQGIVRAHGGELRAEDRPGGGTTFELSLPLTPLETA